jgi:hypothetical protein
VNHHLLYAQGPLLVPRPWETERLIPGGQLDSSRACILREHNGEHLEHDPLHVVFWLLLGKSERVDLHAVAEPAQLRIGHAVSFGRELIPHHRQCPQLAALLDEPNARIDEERNPPDHLRHIRGGHLPGFPNCVEHRQRGTQREGHLLHRCRTRLLQMVAANVDRIPLGHPLDRKGNRVDDQAQRRPRRKDVGPPREVLLDDVILRRSAQLVGGDTPPLGERNIQRHQPRRRRIDRHRGVHLLQRQIREQRVEIIEAPDRDTHLAHLASRERVVGVIARLRRKVERDGQPRLSLGQVVAVERVRRAGRAVPRIGPDHPRSIAFALLAHDLLLKSGSSTVDRARAVGSRSASQTRPARRLISSLRSISKIFWSIFCLPSFFLAPSLRNSS